MYKQVWRLFFWLPLNRWSHQLCLLHSRPFCCCCCFFYKQPEEYIIFTSYRVYVYIYNINAHNTSFICFIKKNPKENEYRLKDCSSLIVIVFFFVCICLFCKPADEHGVALFCAKIKTIKMQMCDGYTKNVYICSKRDQFNLMIMIMTCTKENENLHYKEFLQLSQDILQNFWII